MIGEKTTKREGLARVTEAEQYLGVSRATVYTLMDKGDLAYTKIGRSRRIPWAALQELVERNTIGR